MDIETKFLEELRFPEIKKLFEIAIDMIINKNQSNNTRIINYKNLKHEDKIKITKIYDFLNKATFALKQKGEFGYEGLIGQLDKFPDKEKSFIIEVTKAIGFNKTLNNYKLIQKSGLEGSRKFLEIGEKMTHLIYGAHDFIKLEWKIEIVLSSISMKKVIFKNRNTY